MARRRRESKGIRADVASQLDDWLARERGGGLVDVRAVPGARATVEGMAGEILLVVSGQAPSEDVTEQVL